AAVEFQQFSNDAQINGRLRIPKAPVDLCNLSVNVGNCAYTKPDVSHFTVFDPVRSEWRRTPLELRSPPVSVFAQIPSERQTEQLPGENRRRWRPLGRRAA